MTLLTILGAAVLLLLLPLVITAVRHRNLVAMAGRNLSRRRSEATLLVAGAMLGTAIITSSFVVGDIVGGSSIDLARTQLGPVDVTVTPPEGGDVATASTAIGEASVDDIDGLLPVTTTPVTIEAPVHDTAVPSADVVEFDVPAAQRFGDDPAITGVVDLDPLAAGEVVLNERTADRLGASPGDELTLHAYGTEADVTVAAVIPEVGLAGSGAAIVAPGTLGDLASAADGAAAPPRERLMVSLDGGVFDTRDRSDAAVAALRAAVPGAEVDAAKATMLDEGERIGAEFTELFSTIGAFSVLAGILLLVNLFVMLAEERKTELGMLRAIGFTRRRLTRAFAIEGALYALTAAVIGAVVGIGVGWLVATVAGGIYGVDDSGLNLRLVVDPVSLGTGALIGLLISLLTIWGTSLRIARLNVIRAIRDLPEPRAGRTRTRSLVLGGLGVVVGAALAVLATGAENGFGLLLGVPIAAFSAQPLLARLLSGRVARLLSAGAVLTWGVVAFPLFPDVLGAADLPVFVVQGVVLTAGAIALSANLDRVWMAVVERLGRGGRGLAARLGVAYPLARRFRTSMLLGMFSLVIFTVTLIASMATAFQNNTGTMTDQVAAGYDLVVDANPASPVPRDTLLDRDDVVAVAELARGHVEFEHPDGPRGWSITGFDEHLVAHEVPELSDRDAAYASDAEAFDAVLADPDLAIVPSGFLEDGGPGVTGLQPGDRFAVIEPGTGEARQLTVAGINDADWLWNGVLVSRETTGSLFGAQDVATRSYVSVADGQDPDSVAAALNVAHLANGADAASFAALLAEGVQQETAFLTLLQGFLGLGLLVGIAGLGVVMIRAVRERRQEIGMLRAMGFRAGLVRSALLSEAGLIAVQGTVIGAVLGLVTARQLLGNADAFGGGLDFAVPWVQLVVIIGLPLAAALAATAWPATRAAAIRPAVALRTAD